nr:MAG TPA: hypothetical protein [Caudoviricetes sp.]
MAHRRLRSLPDRMRCYSPARQPPSNPSRSD